MRNSTLSLAVLGAVAALALSACGSGGSSNSSSGGGGSSGGAKGVSAMCKLANPPKSSAVAPSSGAPAKVANASGKVGVILPDTTSSTRYTLYDAPLLKQSFDAAGIQSDIQNAQGDTAKFQSIAQSMIGEGVKVLLIDSIDSTSGIAIEQQATAAGIKVIDYDRVNLGGSAAYYVSFDNE